VGTNALIRIVIADDQLLVREGLRRVFDAVDDMALVGECADGDEVVSVVVSAKPDILLLDMRMKRVGGGEALEMLGRLDARPPVLVLTTFDDEETVREALHAGADGFMLKESVGTDLVRAVRTVAHGGAWLDPEVAGLVLRAYRNGNGGPGASPADLSALTERELEVLRLLALGRTNTEIAGELFIGERTVKTHVGHVFAKLGVRDRVAAVIRAYECGVAERNS
jgi:DNA-binding NarL/FixJ family response regulator